MNEVDCWVAELLARQDGVLARRHDGGADQGQVVVQLLEHRPPRCLPLDGRSDQHGVSRPSGRLAGRAAGLWAERPACGPSGRLVGRRSLGAVGVGRRVVVGSDRRRIGHRRIAEHAQLVMLRPSPAARGVRCRPSQRRSRRRGVICVRDRGTRIVRPGLPAADCAWLRAAPRHRVGLVRADGGARPGRARTAGPRAPDTRQPAESPDSLTTEGMRGSARAGQLLRAAADGDAAASERGLFCPVTHRSPGRADQRFWPFDVPQQHRMA